MTKGQDAIYDTAYSFNTRFIILAPKLVIPEIPMHDTSLTSLLNLLHVL